MTAEPSGSEDGAARCDRPVAVIDVSRPLLAAGLRTELEAAGIDVVDSIGSAGSRGVVLLTDAERSGVGSTGVEVVAVLPGADRNLVWAALAGGASGLVLADGPSSDLVHAVRTAHLGHSFVASGIRSQLVALLVCAPTAGNPLETYALTCRESAVLDLLVRGRSTVEMAIELRISVKMVKLHISNMLRKLGVASRGAAVAIATGNWTNVEGLG